MMKPIRQLREERGKSEFQLADALGVTPRGIHDLEQGIASPSVERSRVLTENNTPMPARATSSTSARSWIVLCRVSASEAN
jgi:transcriptional regulator with XRE-family HTH domain